MTVKKCQNFREDHEKKVQGDNTRDVHCSSFDY